MKKNDYFKCSKCDFSGAPVSLGKHYNEYPNHRRAVLYPKQIQKQKPKQIPTNILEALTDPVLVVNAIDDKISQYHQEITIARNKIAFAETEIKRLTHMRDYFSLPGEVKELKEVNSY